MNKKLLGRILQYFIIPFVLIESCLRIVPDFNSFYLSKTDLFYTVKSSITKVHYYFIGSSHVAAAINPEIINRELQSDNIVALNAGRGYSTGTIFYLALKKLANEGLLDSSKVFIEAPRGLPYYSENRNGEWINESNVHLLIPYLDNQSFLDFWKYSSNSISSKLKLSVNYFVSTIRIGTLAREIFQRNTLGELVSKIGNTMKIKIQKTDAELVPDLTTNGGVKSDPESVENARKLAQVYFKSLADNQKIIEISDWQNSRLNDIISLLNEHNCELIFFDMPISSIEAQVFQTEIAHQNISNAFKFINSKNKLFLSCSGLLYKDEDFPDLWHLSKERSIEYSFSLANQLKH